MKSARLWMLVLGFMALHLVLAALLPLVEDEAYYQLWASVPSAGYYDHPPMVAWGIAAGEALLGPTLLGVRLASVLAVALITLLTYRIAFLFSRDDAVAFRAAVWGAVMLPMSALGFAATPDATSVLFWTAATWALVELLCDKRAGWWLLIGLFAGLGVLSKFTNLFFGLALVIWLVGSREGRGWLIRPQVWLGAVIGVAVLVPLAVWNMDHGWVGLARQFGRIGVEDEFSWLVFGNFWLTFILLVTPVLFWLALQSVLSRKVPAVLIWLTTPVLLYLIYHATKSPTGGRWLVPIFPTLAVMAAIGSEKIRLARWATPSAVLLAVLLLGVGFWPWRALVPGQNPATQWRGWGSVSADIHARMKESGARWIATNGYGLTGQLWHYMGKDVPVWSITAPERYLFRGPFPVSLCRAKGLFISRTDFSGGLPYFRRVTRQKDIVRKSGTQVLVRYYTALVSGPKPPAGVVCRR